MEIGSWPEIWWLVCSESSVRPQTQTSESGFILSDSLPLSHLPSPGSPLQPVRAVTGHSQGSKITVHLAVWGNTMSPGSSRIGGDRGTFIVQGFRNDENMKGSAVFTFPSAPKGEGLVVSHNQIFPSQTVMTILPKHLNSQSLGIFCRNWTKSTKTINLKVTTSRHGETTTYHNELATGLIKTCFACLWFLGIWLRLFFYSDLCP